jgi:hypothetical protein
MSLYSIWYQPYHKRVTNEGKGKIKPDEERPNKKAKTFTTDTEDSPEPKDLTDG